MNTEVGIHFGALAESIATQLKRQGFKYDPIKVRRFQDHERSILKLRFANILPDSAVDKCYKKLHAQIVAHVAAKNKLKVKQ